MAKKTGGSIEDANAFGSIGEEFGLARYGLGHLRDLLNETRMDQVDHSSPHELSQVLSGALYTVMLKLHETWWQSLSGEGADPEYSRSGKALAIAADQFKRMIFRALDYLPPGEVSYADYGRAILAADQASHPKDGAPRRWLRKEWVQRGMVPAASALRVRTNYAHKALEGVDLQALIDSDWAAYQFANENRRLLRIPKGVPFHIEPRLSVAKKYYLGGDDKPIIRECLFKVRWAQTEPNAINPNWPWLRQINVGTTLAIDWQTGKIRALLTTDRSRRPEEEEEQRRDRDLLLRRLVDEDLMRLDERALAHDGQPLDSIVQAESPDGVLRARGTARSAHNAAHHRGGMNMDKLRVRVYNVRFGDAILISVPETVPGEGTEVRHILIDVGNAKASKQGGEGHDDRVFAPVVNDIVDMLNGRPLDLYVMTHEHWDHVQGLPYVDEKVLTDKELKDLLQVRHSWLSGSAAPDYYDTHENAKKGLDDVKRAFADIERLWHADPEQADDPFADVLMINNNPNATAFYVDRLRELAGEANTHYVHRPRARASRRLAGRQALVPRG